MSAEAGAAPEARRLRATAPAKVNFGLRVVGRRADGYHELESVFLPVDLVDDLLLDLAPEAPARVALQLEQEPGTPGGPVPGNERNLAARAARAFLEAAGLEVAVEIRLRKRIPAAAGLGGGSSDAGAVLRALAAAFPQALGPDRLARLALELGADVPFFLDPRPALVTGIGERVEHLEGCPPLVLVLANPGVPLSTAEVYRACDALGNALTPTGRPSKFRPRSDIAATLASGRADALASLLENDLEPAAVRLCPPVARLRERLRAAGAAAVGMSGSGPTVFGVFFSAPAARQALDRLAFAAPVWARVAAVGKGG